MNCKFVFLILCKRDSFIVVAINISTSIFAGFAVFSVLGFMAHQQGVNVADVVESGNTDAI